MTNFREILRLSSLGINNSQIANNLGCSRPTVISALQKAQEIGLTFSKAAGMSDYELYSKLTPGVKIKPVYKTPEMKNNFCFHCQETILSLQHGLSRRFSSNTNVSRGFNYLGTSGL